MIEEFIEMMFLMYRANRLATAKLKVDKLLKSKKDYTKQVLLCV